MRTTLLQRCVTQARLAGTTAAPLRRPWHPLQMLTVRLQLTEGDLRLLGLVVPVLFVASCSPWYSTTLTVAP